MGEKKERGLKGMLYLSLRMTKGKKKNDKSQLNRGRRRGRMLT